MDKAITDKPWFSDINKLSSSAETQQNLQHRVNITPAPSQKIRDKWFTWPQIRCWPPWLAARWDRQPSFPPPSHPSSLSSPPTLPTFLPTSFPNSSYHQPEPRTPKCSFFIHNFPHTDNSSHIQKLLSVMVRYQALWILFQVYLLRLQDSGLRVTLGCDHHIQANDNTIWYNFLFPVGLLLVCQNLDTSWQRLSKYNNHYHQHNYYHYHH